MSSIGRTLGRGVLARWLVDIGVDRLAVLFIGLPTAPSRSPPGSRSGARGAERAGAGGGPSEFLFVGIVAAGGNPIAAALAGMLVNARHLPYGLALPPG